MTLGRIAVVLTTLDERIRLPLTRWLRVAHRADHVHRITPSPAEWDALATPSDVGAQVARHLVRRLEAYSPAVVAVLGHPRATDPPAADPRVHVLNIVRALQAAGIAADVRGFWMTNEWSTGCLQLPRTTPQYTRRAPRRDRQAVPA